MADHGFSSVFILFAVCICTQLDVVLLVDSEGFTWGVYYTENTARDFAIKMIWSNNVLTVNIFYDSGADSAKDFFTNQISAKMIEDLKSCKVANFIFNPCTTSMIKSGSLQCPQGASQCDFDAYVSCAEQALLLQNDESAMGEFLICYYTEGDTVECRKKIKLKVDAIKDCIKNGSGANNCDNYHQTFLKARTKQTDTSKYPDAITNFKITLCQLLKEYSLKCVAVCN